MCSIRSIWGITSRTMIPSIVGPHTQMQQCCLLLRQYCLPKWYTFVPLTACWLPSWVLQVVGNWIQDNQVSIRWYRVWLLHWRGNPQVCSMDGKSPQVRIGLRNAFTGRMFFSGVFLSVRKTTSLESLQSKERLGSLFFYVHPAPLITQPKCKNLLFLETFICFESLWNRLLHVLV